MFCQNVAPIPKPGDVGGQAAAIRIRGDSAAFWGCGFFGAQDTLHDDSGRHYFRDCFIQGSIDFVFGNGKSLYEVSPRIIVNQGDKCINIHVKPDLKYKPYFTHHQGWFGFETYLFASILRCIPSPSNSAAELPAKLHSISGSCWAAANRWQHHGSRQDSGVGQHRVLFCELLCRRNREGMAWPGLEAVRSRGLRLLLHLRHRCPWGLERLEWPYQRSVK